MARSGWLTSVLELDENGDKVLNIPMTKYQHIQAFKQS